MNQRKVFAALVGGVGLVVGLVVTGAVAAVALVALGLPADVRAGDAPASTPDPTIATETTTETQSAPTAPKPVRELVVALAPGEPALQAGVVRGREVVFARGFEVELVRAVAERLGITRLRFVNVAASPRLLTTSGGRWSVAVAAIRPPGVAVPQVALSAPYLPSDQLVLLRRGTSRPRTLAELRTRILCAIRASDGLTAARAVAPAAKPLVAPGPARLVELVRTGACDAALVEPVSASRLVEGRKAVLGPIVARVRFGDGLVMAVRPGSGVDVIAVNRALARLRANGTIARLARFWLGLDPVALPLLR